MKKSAAAIISSLLVLGCAYPVFAAPKNVYTDADSGFAVQTVNPLIEYASKYTAIILLRPFPQTFSPKRQGSFSQRNNLKKNWRLK